MSSGSASHRSTASGNKRDARYLDNEEMFDTSRATAPPTVADATNVHAPPHATHPPDVDPDCVPTNTSALETASEKIEAFVRTLRYPQQRAVFQDNAQRYLHAFAEFYRESKILLKTKDDPSHCPPPCRITIPLQPTQRVRESMAFKALADESARISQEFSLKMAAQILKCKCLNNTDKQRESVEIYAKGLANMAEILLAEVNTSSTTKHDLVADLLSHYEHDAIGHTNMSLDRFVSIYKDVNKLPTQLELIPPKEHVLPTLTTRPNINQPTESARQPPQNATPPTPVLQPAPPTLPNPFLTAANMAATPPNNADHSTDAAAPTIGYVTALSLLTNSLPGKNCLTDATPQLPTPNQPTQTVENAPLNSILDVDNDAITAFEEAFAYDLTPPNADQRAPATPTTNPPPLFTTVNPYSRGSGRNTVHYSREYTTQELESIELAEQSHHAAEAASRTATLNSLRSSGRTMTINLSTATTGPTNDTITAPTATPIDVVHANTRGDTDSSTITGTGDGTTPSSRSTVSFHHTLASGTHHGALHILREAIHKCFAAAQAEYIRAYNAKAIEANLTKIAARQRIEECAESTAITIHSESTPTPRTVGATIDARIRRTQQELEKRLQSLEQRLANERSKSASFERRLQQRQQHQATPAPTTTTQPSAKDKGATVMGATSKKSTTTAQTPTPPTAKPRWTPPPPTAQTATWPAGRGEHGNATPQKPTGRGNNRYAARGRPRHRPTQTRYSGPWHPSA